MTKYQSLSDEALTEALAKVGGSISEGRALTLELLRRNGEKADRIAELEGPAPETAPETETSGDHNAILDNVYGAVPTEKALLELEPKREPQPMFGDTGFGEAWTVRGGYSHDAKHWDGSGGGTNAFLRVPGKAGKYSYNNVLGFYNCLIENAGRWGMRLHGVQHSLRIVGSLIRNIRKEHGVYANLCGGEPGRDAVEIEDTLFVNVDSQALQLVQRDHYWPGDVLGETPDPEVDFTPGGPIVVRNVGVLDGAGPAGDRESFDFSFFRSRNHVTALRTLIDDREQEVSRGFLMAQGYHGLGDPFERQAYVESFVWRSARSKQQCVSFQEMSRVRMENGVIDVPKGSNAKITLDNCSNDVEFSNVTSLNAPVRVVIDGVDAGTVDELSGAK